MNRLSAGLLLACCTVALAQPVPPVNPATPRPRTALVLSGGGARGAAHIGLLRALEQQQIPIDMVVGTSMGAIVGGLYASGLSPDELAQTFLDVEWSDAFTDRPPRRNLSFRRKQDDDEPLFQFELGMGREGLVLPRGLVAGQKLGLALRLATLHVADVDDFDDLPVPFRCVATDLSSGETVVLGRGDLADSIRASMAVPGAFPPVELDGRTLVDGGLVQNLPIAVALEMGAERIIAIDVATPLGAFKKQGSVVEVAAQTFSVLTEQNMLEQRALLRPQDLLIVPDLEEFRSANFRALEPLMQRGLDTGRVLVDTLRRFAVGAEEYRQFLERQRGRRGPHPGGLSIDSIEVVGNSRVHPKLIKRRIRVREGGSLDLATLRDDIQQIYQIGEFEQVDFDVQRQHGKTHLRLTPKDKSWGPYYLRFGLALEADFEGTGEFSALAQFTRTHINRFGAEWKSILSVGDLDAIRTEFYQPLGYSGFWFVSPRVELSRREDQVPDEKGVLFPARNDFALARLDLGVQFKSYGELRVGLQRGTVSSKFSLPAASGRIEADVGGLLSTLTLDRLDNANFPGSGSFVEVEAYVSREDFGADLDYDRVALSWAQAGSFRGGHTLVGQLRYGSSLGSTLPTHDAFRLGGFLRLSGFSPNVLRGNVSGYMSLTYYNQIGRLPGPIGTGFYVGGALEAGNVWQDNAQVSLGDLRPAALVFFGADTIIGAVYLGYGRADGGEDSFYLFLGRPF